MATANTSTAGSFIQSGGSPEKETWGSEGVAVGGGRTGALGIVDGEP
jgi:hypothetical protein